MRGIGVLRVVAFVIDAVAKMPRGNDDHMRASVGAIERQTENQTD